MNITNINIEKINNSFLLSCSVDTCLFLQTVEVPEDTLKQFNDPNKYIASVIAMKLLPHIQDGIEHLINNL